MKKKRSLSRVIPILAEVLKTFAVEAGGKNLLLIGKYTVYMHIIALRIWVRTNYYNFWCYLWCALVRPLEVLSPGVPCGVYTHRRPLRLKIIVNYLVLT